ncbi:MAG: low specificity L-threonine aldolase [Bacteroidales bacterium]|nr:low specificity L-threonine aldolase [Bacteroidales bacterium]MBN2761620.1 low specificity L-threonine aldolase [Bacteroidales bacterium]
MKKRGFASDNNAGIHPALLDALTKANEGHVIAYGDDLYTYRAKELLKEHFGEKAEVFFVLTGTGANVLSLAALTYPHNAVICSSTAHIEVDECGAPEKYTGCKLLTISTPDGKLKPALIKPHLHGLGFEHHVQPCVISISQTTELGTVYKAYEIKELADFAHSNKMLLHMDGARLANAAVTLNSSFKEITTEAGVDVLSFGGTKNGMLFGEAVIFLRPELAEEFKYIRKQGMQLASKMRFISAQFIPYLENGIWKSNALHANRMAKLLYDKVSVLTGVTITQPVQANGIFAIIPKDTIKPLQDKYFFYVWDEEKSEVRWMTSYDTLEEDINDFAETLKALL